MNTRRRILAAAVLLGPAAAAPAFPPAPQPVQGPVTYRIWYYHPNHLGSNSTVTNQSGVVVQERVFRAFGQMAHETATTAFKPSFLFTDQVRDRETGLDYFNARYYDSELGRFAQADTIVPVATDPQSLNRYSYVRNNPIRSIDPSGHSDQYASVVGFAVQNAVATGLEAMRQSYMKDMLSQLQPMAPRGPPNLGPRRSNAGTMSAKINDFFTQPAVYDSGRWASEFVDHLTFKPDLKGPGAELGGSWGVAKAKVGARLDPDLGLGWMVGNYGDNKPSLGLDTSASVSVLGFGVSRKDSFRDKLGTGFSHEGSTKFDVGLSKSAVTEYFIKEQDYSLSVGIVGGGIKFATDTSGHTKGTVSLMTVFGGLDMTVWDSE